MYLDLKELYTAAEDGFAVFQYYFPSDTKLKDRNHKFKLRDERSASASLSYFKGLWRITDFGNQSEIQGMSPIDFVIWKEGLQFADAVKFIWEVILHRTVVNAAFKPTVRKAEYSSREYNPQTDKLNEYKFVFKPKPSDTELKVIGRYVTPEILAKFGCRTVESYELPKYSEKQGKNIVHIYRSTPDYPVFLFDYGTFKKLYRPLELEKQYRFLYIGEKPKSFIFGLKQLLNTSPEFNDDEDSSPEETDDDDEPDDESGAENSKSRRIVKEIFRCSGESDALNLASLGFNVYWLNSESAELDAKQFREIDQYAEKHFQIMDLDVTGQSEAAKNALKHIDLYTIRLPEWIKNHRDWRGNPCKDLKDFINLSGSSKSDTEMDFRILKSNSRRARFWEKSKKKDKEGKKNITFSIENLFFFLTLNGFYRIDKSYVKKHDYMYVKIDNDKDFRLISPDKIKMEVKAYMKSWIESRKMMSILPLLDKINSSVQITENTLEGLPMIRIDFHNASKGNEYLHFKNGMSMHITSSEIKMIRRKEVPNYVLSDLMVRNQHISHVISHPVHLIDKPAVEITAKPEFQALLDEFDATNNVEKRTEILTRIAEIPDIERFEVKINDSEFYFIRFLRDLARLHWRKEVEYNQPLSENEIKEEKLALTNLMYVYGYMASEYKDPGRPWIVVTMDNKISEVGTASGRSGKSVKAMGLRYVRPSFYKGGRDLDNADNFKFIYDGYTEFHNIIEIDDFAEFGLFERFYTEITGAREINPKNYSGFTLDYADSGKMIISTNYELRTTHSSTSSRILYETVSDYYHEKNEENDYLETRKPDMKFGRNLYTDFTPDEWNKFYNFIAYCIQLQMRFYDKINPPLTNIRKRELRREMQSRIGKTDDFFKWANTYFVPKPNNYTSEFAPSENGYFNCYIVRANAYSSFTETLSAKQRSDCRQNNFKDHVISWCKYYGYKFNPQEKLTDIKNSRILKRVNDKVEECFYIAVSESNSAALPAQVYESDDYTLINSSDIPF